jgi:protein TonB
VASAAETRQSNASPSASPAKNSAASSQPSSRMNSVAHEAAVTASGARPGKSGGQRELFTEETTTVLVFENGGVLRLAAAVVPGQLLFITNKGTRREVVAQVVRKRDFKPTSCYVEVEFSEPSPGFWGIDFPETPQLVPSNAHQREAAELVHSAKVISGKPSAPAPSTHEVTALKQEVEALREQLKLLQTQTAGANSSVPLNSSAPTRASVPVAIPDPPLAPTAAEARPEQSPNPPSVAPETPAVEIASVPRVSTALPIEPSGPPFSEEVHLPKPVIRVNRAKPPANRSAKPKATSAANAGPSALRIALLSAPLFLGAAGAAWFLHWIPWLPPPKIISASVPTSTAVQPAPPASAAPAKTTDALTQLAPAGDVVPSKPAKPETPAPADVAMDPGAVPEKSAVTAASAAKRSELRPTIKTTSAAAEPLSQNAAIVPPKLIKSVLAIASPNALQYFDKGNTATVTLDAVVDATGRVKSMKVLSGPASLRGSAMDALKQYRYEPATLRGKPVAARVAVTIKFLFEP